MKTAIKNKLRRKMISSINKRVDMRANRVKVVPMNADGDSLFVLRDKCLDDIKLKKQELAALELKLRSINEFIGEAKPLMMPDNQTDKYAALGLTESVLDAVGCLCKVGRGTQHGVTPSQVRHYLIHHGFPLPANARNFTITVNTTLVRLTKSQRLERTEDIGVIFYKPVKQISPPVGAGGV